MGAQAVRNDVMRVIQELQLEAFHLNSCILRTPTGEERNYLTEAAIYLNLAKDRIASAIGASINKENQAGTC
jgi:hypothetical protein